MSPPSASLTKVRKKTTSGTVKPLPLEQWTAERKETISLAMPVNVLGQFTNTISI